MALPALMIIIFTLTRRQIARLRELRARIYDRACVRTGIYMRMHLYPREFVLCVHAKIKMQFLTCVCVRLRACVCVRVFVQI